MNESEAIDIILDNKKEYEEIIKELEDVGDGNDKPIKTIQDCQKFVQAIETILDLYNKEKEKNKTLEELLQGRLFELYNYYKDLAGSYQANCISKDKIREMQRYREFELQQEYKDFENDVEWKTYNKILEEE